MAIIQIQVFLGFLFRPKMEWIKKKIGSYFDVHNPVDLYMHAPVPLFSCCTVSFIAFVHTVVVTITHPTRLGSRVESKIMEARIFPCHIRSGRTGCSLNIVFFLKILKYIPDSGLTVFKHTVFKHTVFINTLYLHLYDLWDNGICVIIKCSKKMHLEQ